MVFLQICKGQVSRWNICRKRLRFGFVIVLLDYSSAVMAGHILLCTFFFLATKRSLTFVSMKFAGKVFD